MQIVGQTWLNLVTVTCWSWSVGQHDLYFTVQLFCPISWRLFNVCTSYFRSMNPYDTTFHLRINVGHCDLYVMVQWLCLIPWRLFHVWTSLFGIMNQYDPMHDLKVNVGHCDLYSWSSDVVLYLEDYLMYEHHRGRLKVSITGRLTSNYVTVTCISWSTDFALYLKDYLMDECNIFR